MYLKKTLYSLNHKQLSYMCTPHILPNTTLLTGDRSVSMLVAVSASRGCRIEGQQLLTSARLMSDSTPSDVLFFRHNHLQELIKAKAFTVPVHIEVTLPNICKHTDESSWSFPLS